MSAAQLDAVEQELSQPQATVTQASPKPRAHCGKRLATVLSIAMFFLLGTPVWHQTTQLRRIVLPFERMISLDSVVTDLPISIRLWLCTDSVQAGGMHGQSDGHVERILMELERLGVSPFTATSLSLSAVWVSASGCASADPRKLLRGAHSSKASSWTDCPEVYRVFEGDALSDVAVEEALQNSFNGVQPQAGEYDMFVLDASILTTEAAVLPKIVMGKHRLSWVVGNVWDILQGSSQQVFSGQIASAAALATAMLVNGNSRRSSSTVPAGDTPLVETGSLKLLLTLCNAHPPGGSCRWDASWIEEVALSPVLAALRPLGDIQVDSNVLQYTSSHVSGSWNESTISYLLQPAQLPAFIDSNWNLMPDSAVQAGGKGDTSLAPHNALRLVVYIPPEEQRPLQVLPGQSVRNDTQLQHFTVSSWGGVMLFNPYQGCCRVDVPLEDKVPRPSTDFAPCRNHRELSASELLEISEVSVSQLRAALGLLTVQDVDTREVAILSSIPNSVSGFADWEVDLLIRRQFQLQTAAVASTLSSLARLVRSLSNLPIPSEVPLLVQHALDMLQDSRTACKLGSYHVAADKARLAKQAADKAFFHPSIMADQSYPVQHLIAMYMPYFLPVTVPILRGVWNEMSRRRMLWLPLSNRKGSKIKAE